MGVEQEFLRSYPAAILSYKKAVNFAEKNLGPEDGITQNLRNVFENAKVEVSTILNKAACDIQNGRFCNSYLQRRSKTKQICVLTLSLTLFYLQNSWTQPFTSEALKRAKGKARSAWRRVQASWASPSWLLATTWSRWTKKRKTWEWARWRANNKTSSKMTSKKSPSSTRMSKKKTLPPTRASSSCHNQRRARRPSSEPLCAPSENANCEKQLS